MRGGSGGVDVEGELESSKAPNEALIIYQRKRHAPKFSDISIGKEEIARELIPIQSEMGKGRCCINLEAMIAGEDGEIQARRSFKLARKDLRQEDEEEEEGILVKKKT